MLQLSDWKCFIFYSTQKHLNYFVDKWLSINNQQYYLHIKTTSTMDIFVDLATNLKKPDSSFRSTYISVGLFSNKTMLRQNTICYPVLYWYNSVNYELCKHQSLYY